MKVVLALLLCTATYGISFGALLSAFLFASAHDDGRSSKPSDIRDLKQVALAGLVSSLLFWPALLLIKLILKA